MLIRARGQKRYVTFIHYLLADFSAPLTFQAFDGPAQCGIFPTDFSSTMPSADSLTAIVDIAVNPLQVFVLFVSSDSHQNSCLGHDDLNTPRIC